MKYRFSPTARTCFAIDRNSDGSTDVCFIGLAFGCMFMIGKIGSRFKCYTIGIQGRQTPGERMRKLISKIRLRFTWMDLILMAPAVAGMIRAFLTA